MTQRAILFLSGLDFKEKSIQVIRKTPEAYVKNGWNVYYIVARNNSIYGSYSYENEINIPGVQIERFNWPLITIHDWFRNKWIRLIVLKISSIVVVYKLFNRSRKQMKIKDYQIIYGYEIQGVLAIRLLKIFNYLKKSKVVTRFQGTWITQIIEKRQIFRLLWNIDHVVALRTNSSLCIMTDDGTRGDVAMKMVLSKSLPRLKFWVNGVDFPSTGLDREAERQRLGVSRQTVLLVSVSRLDRWKRVDRNIQIAAELDMLGLDFKYFIVGEGGERGRLESQALALNVSGKIEFLGAVKHDDVERILSCSDIFLSMYDLSNVGNPLLEAIRAEKIIVTLSNGDTGSWIKHRENGLIYDPLDQHPRTIAQDIADVCKDPNFRDSLRKGVKQLGKSKLWTWEERLNTEIAYVEKTIN